METLLVALMFVLVAARWGSSLANRVRPAGFVSSPCFESSGTPSTVVRTFVFADLVGFTALAEQRGDLDAARFAERFAWMSRQALRGHAELVKTMGDGVMLVAESNADALATAVALFEIASSEPGFPPVALGVHRGNAVALGRDYIGAAVNVAARVAERARPGRILVTEAVVESDDSHTGARMVPEGLVELRSIRDPVFLYELTPGERTALPCPCPSRSPRWNTCSTT